MAWHGSNEFGEKVRSAPVNKTPRPVNEVRDFTHKALVVSEGCSLQTSALDSIQLRINLALRLAAIARRMLRL